MQLDEFDYDLDDGFIAQTPLKDRSSSKLLVLDKNKEEILHKKFTDIIDYLDEGDALVLNNTKVLPARIIGVKEDTKAVIEILLLNNIKDDLWECLTKPARRVKVGTIINFSDKLKAECIEEKEEGIRVFKLLYKGILMEILDSLGSMPLPPYIHEKLKDKDRYQTVYAKEIGSAAAPTAGLHFTKELLDKIKNKKVNIVYVTLHVGLGTFRPVNVTNIKEHKMHSEFYNIDKKSCEILNNVKKNGKKIVAVGTTSTRVLETVYKKYNKFKESSGFTDIFIYPGYKFEGIDNLITNFHLPKSTLLMLVSALATKDLILKAYEEAKEKNYRFFSFGDAMYIKIK